MESIIQDAVKHDEQRELGVVYYLNTTYVTRDGLEWSKSHPFVKNFDRFINFNIVGHIPIPPHFHIAIPDMINQLKQKRKFEIKNSHFNEWFVGYISPTPCVDNYDEKKLLKHTVELAKEFSLFREQINKASLL